MATRPPPSGLKRVAGSWRPGGLRKEKEGKQMESIKGLDAHITGPCTRPTVVRYSCPRCKTIWTAPAFTEYGGVYLTNEDDADCPECGAAGEERT